MCSSDLSYRAASDAVFGYLQKEGIDYIGDVIPSDEQGDFDFDNQTEFEFLFEIGEAPEVNLEFTAKDKVTYYTIKIDEKMHADYRANFLRRFGRLMDVDEVAGDEALSVTLDNGEIRVEDAYVGLISMSEQERKPFMGQRVGFKTTVNIDELYKTPSQRAAVHVIIRKQVNLIRLVFQLNILDRKSTRLNSSHMPKSRMPSSA